MIGIRLCLAALGERGITRFHKRIGQLHWIIVILQQVLSCIGIFLVVID